MPLTFNTILREASIPLSEVRLVRHKDNRAERGRTPYELWRDNRPEFESYQSTQSINNQKKKKLSAPFWAVFLGTPSNETMFVGLYGAKYKGPLAQDKEQPQIKGGIDKAGTCDVYDLTLEKSLSEFIGRLFIDWGDGALAWIQRAVPKNKKEKLVTELRTAFTEPAFPGFLNFVEPLSKLDSLPQSWKVALTCSGGVYLLTCPKTKEHYVGAATGAQGFWGRWQDYVKTGHGGNVILKSRDLSDYQVTILEVAGTTLTEKEILKRESIWMSKLQSRAIGLNHPGGPAKVLSVNMASKLLPAEEVW